MTKKKTNLLSYLPILSLIITILGLIITGVIGYTRFQAQAETTKLKVEELKADTKTKIEKVEADIKEIANEGDKEIGKIKEDIKDTEGKVNINKTQQDNIQAQVQQVSEKTDKIYDILLELKAKKK